MNIEHLIKCYKSLEKMYPCNNNHLDNENVVRTVEKYRRHWKPDEVKILLLAESHIHTTPEECELTVDHARYELNDSPTNKFVRFIYCLGYGENKLLSSALMNNNGTPQYWKLLYSCINKITKNEDFPVILSKRSKWESRVKNKYKLLKELQEEGIWLLDSSIVGLYPKSFFCEALRNQIIRISWDNYINSVIKTENPKKLIFIGKGLYEKLRNKVTKFKPEWIYQPQARLKSNGHIKNYQKLFTIINNNGTN